MPKIEIDLADLGLTYDEDGNQDGARSLPDLVIDGAVALLFRDSNLRDEVRKQVAEQVSTTVKDKVAVLVSEAFDAPIQRTTSWGEAKGEPTTVREIIRLEIERFMTAKSDGRRNSYDAPRNLSDLMADTTTQILTKDLKVTVDAAKANVHNTVTQKALAAAVAELSK